MDLTGIKLDALSDEVMDHNRIRQNDKAANISDSCTSDTGNSCNAATEMDGSSNQRPTVIPDVNMKDILVQAVHAPLPENGTADNIPAGTQNTRCASSILMDKKVGDTSEKESVVAADEMSMGICGTNDGVQLFEEVQKLVEDLLLSAEKLSDVEVCKVDDDNDGQISQLMGEHNHSAPKCGNKRTFSETKLDEISEPKEELTSDSVYIMSVVEEELKAVKQGLDKKTKDNKMVGDSDNELGVSSNESLSDSNDESGSSDESSSDSSTESDSTSSDENSMSHSELRKIIEDVENEEDQIHTGPPRTKDELVIANLPLEPEVDIQLDIDANMVHIGDIAHSVETMVVIQALQHSPALDIETLLFLENRTCIGKIFETFGPVQSPYYTLRFNSEQDIKDKCIEPGVKVFFAPEDSEYTKLVFTAQLRKMKGSDASWQHDQEPPNEFVEYSDDEQEAQVKSKKRQEKKANRASQQEDNMTESSSPSTKMATHHQRRQQHRVFQRTWQGRGRGLGNAYRQTGPRVPPPQPSGPVWRGHAIPPGRVLPLRAAQPPPPFLGSHPGVRQGHYCPPPPGPYPMNPGQPPPPAPYRMNPGQPPPAPYPMNPGQPPPAPYPMNPGQLNPPHVLHNGPGSTLPRGPLLGMHYFSPGPPPRLPSGVPSLHGPNIPGVEIGAQMGAPWFNAQHVPLRPPFGQPPPPQ